MQLIGHEKEDMAPYLSASPIIDCDHPRVREFAEQAVSGVHDSAGRAVKLYLSVRDGIRYDPYAPFHLPEHYRASYVLERGRSFCIPKASLLSAAARVVGIPARLGFANVRNHLATRQLIEYLGADIFVFHAFVELYIGGKWVKATPAFNKELCERHKVAPLEFNGTEDSLFQAYNQENQRFMEYTELLGTYSDVPVADILTAWEKTYGKDRVESWIKSSQEKMVDSVSNFEREEVWNR